MKNITKQYKSSSRLSRQLILMFLLLSGFCGLIYEIVWMKMLTLVIGNTIFSITTVLTAFMGGLALGSFLAGMLESKIKNPLRVYGILECAIGIYALLLPLLIAGTEPIFRFIYQNTDTSFYAFSLLRFLICGIILLIPTTLMGATLPVLSKYLVEKSSTLGSNVAMLYGVNTLGAVLGSFSAGFILVPAIGIKGTIYIAALINILIAVNILFLDRNSVKGDSRASREKGKGKQKEVKDFIPPYGRAIIVVVLVGIGLSGMASMAYQIAWTRVFSLSLGASVYAFSLIVTTFIFGMALGSILITKFIDRLKNLVFWLALMEGIIGLSALLVVHTFGKLPVYVAEFLFAKTHSFQYTHFMAFGIVFALIFAPTLMMGATVPMAIKICTTDVNRVGRFFGNVYAANTLGGIIGSFVAGFVLIPWLGTQNSIFVAAAINITIAGVMFLYASPLSLSIRTACTLLTAMIAALVVYPTSKWDASILTSGPYLYANSYKDNLALQGIDMTTAMKSANQTLFFKEGLNAVVSVNTNSTGDLYLRVNGKTDASVKGDVATQLMLGHLPLLLHQSAEDILVIGLGSGMTIGAVNQYAVKNVDILEIEPAVVEADKYFNDFTGDPLNDGRVNLIVGDGRTHAALTKKKYDVIISEPSNPWISGMGNLFTAEFFELAKKRFQKGGIMCQWVHAYSMSSIDFKTIVRTFHAVFPHVMVWEANLDGDYLLIGSEQELNVDAQKLINRLSEEKLKSDFTKMGMRNLSAFINKIVITDKVIDEYTRGAPLHTDDNSLLEYSAPKSLFHKRSTRLLDDLYRYRLNPEDLIKSLQWAKIPSPIKNDLSQMFQAKRHVLAGISNLAKDEAQEATRSFRNALALDPLDYDAAYLLAELFHTMGRLLKGNRRLIEAKIAYKECIKVIDDFVKGDKTLLIDYFNLELIYAEAYRALGVLAMEANNLKQAASDLQQSLSGEIHLAESHSNLGLVYSRLGKLDLAESQFQHAIELNPYLIEAWVNFGNLRFKQGKYQEVIEILDEAKKLWPDSERIRYELGMTYFKQAEWAKAEKELVSALKLKPDLIEAQKSLEMVRNKMRSR